jgi:O-antigen/teichoic acid export membrane protein
VGKVKYGIWMTISSIIQWFAFFDMGMGNGLRNKLAEALAKNDEDSAKVYISSVFAIITGIAALLFLLFIISAPFISWNAILNTNLVPNKELIIIVIVVFFFFCIGFVLSLVSTILQATQRYSLNNIIGLMAQLLGLVAIFILVKTTNGSLFYLCLVFGSKSVVVLSIASIFLFSRSLKKLKPSLKYIHIKRAMPLLTLGIKFFIIQIFYLIVTQTSVILVAQFFGPENVTTFNLAITYTTITSIMYLMVLTPFLSAFTEAYTKNEYNWIRKTIKQINIIWLLVSISTIILVFCSQMFFKLWVGDKIIVPVSLIIVMAISSIINTWSSTYSLFLNGIGKIQIQLYLLGIQALLVFPISYLFYNMGWGLISIVATQIIFYSANAILMTVQYKKIMNRNATGIWYN